MNEEVSEFFLQDRFTLMFVGLVIAPLFLISLVDCHFDLLSCLRDPAAELAMHVMLVLTTSAAAIFRITKEIVFL